jgi:hypothetical protein
MVAGGLVCLLRFVVLAGVPADPVIDEASWPGGHPSLELSSAFFTNGAASPEGRSVLREQVRAEGHEGGADVTYFGSLGWVTLFEAGGAGGAHQITRRGNLTFGGRYHFGWRPFGFHADVGFAAVLGLSNVGPSAERRVARAAYLHAVAMDGAWDAWAWAPAAVGLALPLRMARLHQLGRWRTRLDLEATLAATRPRQEGLLEYAERDPGRLVQAGIGYFASPWPWLGAGTRLQLVWMPTAPVFHTQTAVRPAVVLGRGPWRLATELLVNIGEPYGFMGSGQRVWALHVGLGVWL